MPHPRLAVAVCLLCFSSRAATEEDATRQELRDIYTFSPHTLTTQQIDEKSKVLDALWARAKAQKDAYIPALRSELGRTEAQPFFLYDGSMLLLALSDTAADRRLALNAIARCDLQDVQHSDYFRQVHRLATRGEDTTEAALHILVAPDFKAFVPQHALTLDQNYALIYMVLPLDHAQWLPAALARLREEREQTAQKSLLLLAWYAQTGEADAALVAFAADGSKPGTSRDYARELAGRKAAIGLLARARAMLSTEETLRAQRRELMKRVSDEALIEFDEKTALLAAKRQ